MPEAPSETRQALWYWEDSLRATRGTVALTSSGHPVVPSDFDSFQGTAIGFDHVFTGHFKDLMNVAFTFLPTQVYRKSFEKAILSLMRSKHQTTQARLYSAQKQKLMTMSTTQKYSLLPFVASAYSLVIKDVPGVEEGAPEFKEYLELIQRSLASLADLIGAIWRFPKYCNGSQGCKNPDGLVLPKKQIPLEYRARFSCIRHLEKPNTHRLLEYVIEQSLGWAHPVWMGELSLERAHQKMKAALKKTNAKEEHIQVMNATRFNDWLGRITSVISHEGPSISIHIPECARLLNGRNTSATVNDPAFVNKLTTFLTPTGLVYKTILRDGGSAFGKHGIFCRRPMDKTIVPLQDTKNISHIDLFNFPEQGLEVCNAVGLPYHHTNNPSFFSKLLKQCNCPQRRHILSAGDVHVTETFVNGARTSTFNRILFFVRQQSGSPTISMVLERCTLKQPETTPAKIIVPTNPPVYSIDVLTPSKRIYPLLHNCASAKCKMQNDSTIRHFPTPAGEMEYAIMDCAMAFPPRRG